MEGKGMSWFVFLLFMFTKALWDDQDTPLHYFFYMQTFVGRPTQILLLDLKNAWLTICLIR